MAKQKGIGVKVTGHRGRATTFFQTPEQAKLLDACQALLNAGNPAEGELTKVDTIALALQLLYKKLRAVHAGVKKSVKEVREQAGEGKGKGRTNGPARPSDPQAGEPMCDLDAIDQAVAEAKANYAKEQRA